MFENTKLSPAYNGYQYLFIFIVTIFINSIVQFFSCRKYYGIKNGNPNVVGFAPEMAIYYRSLYNKGPLAASNIDTLWAKCNMWILGSLIAGLFAVLALFLTDIILHIIDTVG